jgi:hypothetical protein
MILYFYRQDMYGSYAEANAKDAPNPAITPIPSRVNPSLICAINAKPVSANTSANHI